MLTGAPKEFHEQVQWGAETLKENVTTDAVNLNMITQLIYLVNISFEMIVLRWYLKNDI